MYLHLHLHVKGIFLALRGTEKVNVTKKEKKKSFDFRLN